MSDAPWPGMTAPSPELTGPALRTTVRDENGRPTRVDCPTPRALATDEIPRLVEDYRRATVNAREAGFDLVEIHARTATFCTGSSPPTATSAPTSTAARWPTVPG